MTNQKILESLEIILKVFQDDVKNTESSMQLNSKVLEKNRKD
jgi:hypothetical protein